MMVIDEDPGVKNISLRLPSNIYDQVRELAKPEHRTVHAQIVHMLGRSAVERHRGTPPGGTNEHTAELVKAEWDSTFAETIPRSAARISDQAISDIRPYLDHGARLVEVRIRVISEIYPAIGPHQQTNPPYSDADLSAIFRSALSKAHEHRCEFIGGREIALDHDSIEVTVATIDLTGT